MSTGASWYLFARDVEEETVVHDWAFVDAAIRRPSRVPERPRIVVRVEIINAYPASAPATFMRTSVTLD